MNKTFKFINETFRVFIAASLIMVLLFAMSCSEDDKDPEPELYPLSGVYTFNKAILQTQLVIPGIPFPIAKGTDITTEMADGLLAEAPCEDPSNGAVELKTDKKLFFTCIGETNEESAGTWDVNSDSTELNLNLILAIGNLPLKIQELEIDEVNDVIGGSIIGFPLTPDLIAGFLSALPQEQIDAIIAQLPGALLVDVDIEFKKVSESQ